MKNERSCFSHECEDCGKKLQPGKWWHVLIIFVVIFSVMGGLIYFLNTSVYDPRCWLQEDELGYSEELGVKAMKQFPIPCSDFIVE